MLIRTQDIIIVYEVIKHLTKNFYSYCLIHRDISLQIENILPSLPLCMGITFANFIIFGKMPSLKVLLHIRSNGS